LMATQQTYGLPKLISLKIGIRYMITANIDIPDGLVNGTSGILRNIDLTVKDDEAIPQTLWFEYETEHIGHRARSLAPKRQFEEKLLTPIRRVIREIHTKTEAKFVLVCRQQYPLVPAEAITIHKAQGQTYDQVVVDLGQRLMLSKLYTACSRARTSSGLFLTGDSLKLAPKRPLDHPIELELKRLETSAQLVFGVKFLRDLALPVESTTIYYHNVQHLGNGFLNLLSDANIASADLSVLVEAHGRGLDRRGFHVLAILDFAESRPHGIVVYGKTEVCAKFEGVLKCETILFGDSHIEYLVFGFGGKLLMAVYISPGFPKADAIQHLNGIVSELARHSRPLTMMGDFNIDLQSPNGTILETMLQRLGLVFVGRRGHPTNNFANQIDLVFASFRVNDCFTYESLQSDHKPIFLNYQ